MNSPEAFFVTYTTLTAPASGVSTPVQLGEEINTRNYVMITSGRHQLNNCLTSYY